MIGEDDPYVMGLPTTCTVGLLLLPLRGLKIFPNAAPEEQF
jgi:hypothetical protein